MIHRSRRFIALLSVVALALTVAACGDDEGSGSAAAPTPGNSTDRAFVAGMVPHHESAVDMARVALDRGQSPFVKQLAQDIVDSQTKELATMRDADKRLAAAGVKPGAPEGGHSSGMGEEDPAQALKTAEPFDEAFIKEMLPHHKSALPMAQAEIDKGADVELKKVAQAIIDGQTREIAAMEKHAQAEFGSVPQGEEHGGHSG